MPTHEIYAKAMKANNYFGMKCSLSGNTWDSVWDGVSKYTKQTKEQKSSGSEYTVTADFRKYPDMETSVREGSTTQMQCLHMRYMQKMRLRRS